MISVVQKTALAMGFWWIQGTFNTKRDVIVNITITYCQIGNVNVIPDFYGAIKAIHK